MQNVDAQASASGAATCAPNSRWCDGNVLNFCGADGQTVTTTACDVCGDIGGLDGCIDQVCEPGVATCDGPARQLCNADGTAVEQSLCPEGMGCSGDGQCAPVLCSDEAPLRYDNGQITVYWFGQGTVQNFGDISCSFGIQPGNPGNGDGDAVNGIANPALFGAMNTADYQNAAACGQCVELRYQGRAVNITIVDECPIGSNPTCTQGHIDLSRGAWNQLTNNAGGNEFGGVSWNFAPCPTEGPVTFELKEPSNAYWNEVLVRNHRFEIERLEIQMLDGSWVDANRQSYNYWRSPVGSPDGDMGTYRVRAWDVNGGAVEAQLALTPGEQPAERQFACQ